MIDNSMCYTTQKLLSNVLKRNINVEYLNLRCTREFHVQFLNIKKWCEGLNLILNSCVNVKILNIQCILYYYNCFIILFYFLLLINS